MEQELLLDLFELTEKDRKTSFAYFYHKVIDSDIDDPKRLLKKGSEYLRKVRFTFNKIKLRRRILDQFN